MTFPPPTHRRTCVHHAALLIYAYTVMCTTFVHGFSVVNIKRNHELPIDSLFALPVDALPIDSFNAWVKMRLGVGSGPGSADMVYWVGSGEVYEAFSGKILAKFEGFDVARGVIMDEDDNGNINRVRQLSRKIFWFRDPTTGDIMKEYEGRPVHPIQYDYQAFDYRRSPSERQSNTGNPAGSVADMWTSLPPILPSIVSSRVDVPVMPISGAMAGKDRLAFQCPIFIDVEIPNTGPYQAYEFYDYNFDVNYPEDQPPLAVWCRHGNNPPFAEDGNGVMKFVGHRVSKFDDLPLSIKELLQQEDYKLYKKPPDHMAEC